MFQLGKDKRERGGEDTTWRYRTKEPCFLYLCPLKLRAVFFPIHCFSVAVVKPTQTAAAINNYIIKLQARGQQDKDHERRTYKREKGDKDWKNV